MASRDEDHLLLRGIQQTAAGLQASAGAGDGVRSQAARGGIRRFEGGARRYLEARVVGVNEHGIKEFRQENQFGRRSYNSGFSSSWSCPPCWCRGRSRSGEGPQGAVIRRPRGPGGDFFTVSRSSSDDPLAATYTSTSPNEKEERILVKAQLQVRLRIMGYWVRGTAVQTACAFCFLPSLLSC